MIESCVQRMNGIQISHHQKEGAWPHERNTALFMKIQFWLDIIQCFECHGHLMVSLHSPFSPVEPTSGFVEVFSTGA